MILITIYQDPKGRFTGFDSEGHAEYAESGSDIVCAAVSALIINGMNSIEQLTGDEFTQEFDEEQGVIRYRLTTYGHDAQLLFHSMILGLEEIESNYSEYMDVIFKEV